MIIFRIRKDYRFIVLLCITTIVVFYTGQLSSNSLVDLVKNALRPLDRIISPRNCGCLKCMTQPDDDLWFQKRFITSFKPFLTREYKTLSNDTRTWWLKLQKEHTKANFSEVVEKLFQVIPEADLYMDAGPERCRTCAVVGNSGNLKGSHYGALIDSSDVIIRMNKAPTSGYEQDVGSRTTHHIMYPESAIDLDNTTSLVLFPFKTLDLQWLPGAITNGSHITFSYARLRAKIKANKDLVLVLNPVFMKYVHEVWLDYYGKYPSTGFMALILALHICDEVNVYGFGKDRNGNWHHYWETLTNKKLKTGPHPGDYEYNVTRKLSEIHKLEMYKGW
ncbi:CMP-N-acetylneuraminate-beta-galactosamide-alpha-2,3-sialyltransferase 1 [Coregonus clupeaformis]|uniref:CMP-N-acetylneuraminate-beta-galactosamide- alpha-2,3-sialyltransferase 1 n=1 Tax=Coregonus clupeaformis TaxID=59861 RepID=UPI001BE04A46|nr:CMP-N-acetylneuraminate-beta-galactosamide-alpha-2,3-sialyltransferase 1 [Coregonus clupeaformis]XP_041707350.1 CMP-N-acetylneuraminate-beta-galactosamide-alpha-2,3-sialyltransferase 1 [Coregonus clupeaformis]